jgi:hypothetical protein
MDGRPPLAPQSTLPPDIQSVLDGLVRTFASVIVKMLIFSQSLVAAASVSRLEQLSAHVEQLTGRMREHEDILTEVPSARSRFSHVGRRGVLAPGGSGGPIVRSGSTIRVKRSALAYCASRSIPAFLTEPEPTGPLPNTIQVFFHFFQASQLESLKRPGLTIPCRPPSLVDSMNNKQPLCRSKFRVATSSAKWLICKSGLDRYALAIESRPNHRMLTSVVAKATSPYVLGAHLYVRRKCTVSGGQFLVVFLPKLSGAKSPSIWDCSDANLDPSTERCKGTRPNVWTNGRNLLSHVCGGGNQVQRPGV